MDKFYSVEEAALQLGLDTSHLRRLLRNGVVEGKKLGRDWVVLSLDYNRKRRPKSKTGGDMISTDQFEMDVIVGGGLRRLPIYLLLDTSMSMRGDPIRAVEQGVQEFKREVERDIFAQETVWVGVITFGDKAKFVTNGLVSVDQFKPPALIAEGDTPLGEALNLLADSLDEDVKHSVKGREKGDWKPLVFILTDGYPTDNWEEPRKRIIDRLSKKVFDIVTIGCGPGVSEENLKNIAMGSSYKIDVSETSFKSFFKWVTQSVIFTSRSVNQMGAGDQPGTLPDPPDTIQYIP